MGFIKITRTLLLLLMAAGLASCVKEREVDVVPGKKPVDDNALVRLGVRVPGNASHATRALEGKHEDEVSEVMVFVFEKASGNWNTKLRFVGKSLGEPTGDGTTKEFTVQLVSGEWDLWVVANAKSLTDALQTKYGVSDIYSKEFIELNLDKQALQANLVKTLAGKWNVDPNDAAGAYRIPMWGMLNGQKVQTSSTAIIKTVNLHRMISKIDVEVQRDEDEDEPIKYPGIAPAMFELTYVSLHNYNTAGRLVPGLETTDGNWLDQDGAYALKTSLPGAAYEPFGVYGWEPEKRLEYSSATDFTTGGTAMNGVIYTFEQNKGDNGANRPCIIIGGRYDGGDVSYYRADFLDKNDQYLNILRNHKYRFLIRKIGGKGFPSVEDAYKAGPTNLEAEVIEWNDGGFVEGVWNGTHEIRFTGTKYHFNQFADPAEQSITVRTNVPTFSMDEFAGGAAWSKVSDTEYTNGHFTVKMQHVDTEGAYKNYKITVKAEPTAEGDLARESTFKVKGYMLEATLTITQDAHVKYRLSATPADEAIGIDGAKQRIAFDVSSTHPYQVEYSEAMFLGVYDVAYGGTPIDKSNIPVTTKIVYVEVSQQTEQSSRSGGIDIKHIDTESTATPLHYVVTQGTPALTAELVAGGLTATLPKAGGDVQIRVTSNLTGWFPLLTIKRTAQPDENYTGDLLTYFDKVQGTQTGVITFSLDALPGTTDIVYEIQFKDVNNLVATVEPIVITHKYSELTLPTAGALAPPGIIGVGATTGKLTLDGSQGYNGGTAGEDVYVVYFKWNSTIAISAGTGINDDPYDVSQIAWVPEEFAGNISAMTTWNSIPISPSAQIETTPESLANGHGDPCRLALKNGTKGEWRMPTGKPYEKFPYTSQQTLPIPEWIENEGLNDNTNGQFYPYAGVISNNGRLTAIGASGVYLTSTLKEGLIGTLGFGNVVGQVVNPGGNASFDVAVPIRCVRDETAMPTKPITGALAAPGVIGVGKETGKLTLKGSKEFSGQFSGTENETVFAVYFKWGSMIAIHAGSGGNDPYEQTDIAWVPSEFNGNVNDLTSWADINYAGDSRNANTYATSFPTNAPEELAAGLGDPCKYLSKDGVNWKMPTSTIYPQAPTVAGGTWAAGMTDNGHWFNKGGASQQYYPAAGYRNYYTGALTSLGDYGVYWSDIPHNTTKGRSLLFNNSVSDPESNHNRAGGVTIRCVREKEEPAGIPAAEGILGVNNKGELNLDGQKYVNDPSYPDITSNNVVYFKWGSVVAIRSNTDTSIPFSAEDVIWAPGSLKTTLQNSIGTSTGMTAWDLIPYADEIREDGVYENAFPSATTPAQTAQGIGDPCKLATKNGVATTGYRMPQGIPYEQSVFRDGLSETSNPYWKTAEESGYGYVGSYDDTFKQFYPAAGYRNNYGSLIACGNLGRYWTSHIWSYNMSFTLWFNSTQYDGTVISGLSRSEGAPVRCVKD